MAALYNLTPGAFPQRASVTSDRGRSRPFRGIGVDFRLWRRLAQALALIWTAVAVGFLSLIAIALLAG